MARRSTTKSSTKTKKVSRTRQAGSRPRRAASLSGFSGVFKLHDDLVASEGGAIVSFLIAQPASKSVAVNAAITNQLVKDGRWPPMDLTKVMNAIPYRYTTLTMRNFLDGVAATLAAGLPPYKFNWNSAFVNKALPLTVAALMAEIELATQ